MSKVTFVSSPAAAVADEPDAGAETIGEATVADGRLSGAALVECEATGGVDAVGRSQPAAAVSPIRAQAEGIHFIARFSFYIAANQ
jgi:hypothetical protein